VVNPGGESRRGFLKELEIVMVMTSHPSHPTGASLVKVVILNDTVCQPHGDVAKGDVVEVSLNEYFKLYHANKAELATADVAASEPDPADSGLVTADQFREELLKKTKAELVAGAKENYGINLSENQKKEELVAAIVAAAIAAESAAVEAEQ
jgi:hypothetical protein